MLVSINVKWKCEKKDYEGEIWNYKTRQDERKCIIDHLIYIIYYYGKYKRDWAYMTTFFYIIKKINIVNKFWSNYYYNEKKITKR